MFNGSASKFVVYVVGAVAVGLTTYYPASSHHWVPLVVEVLTGIGVYLVPNTPVPNVLPTA